MRNLQCLIIEDEPLAAEILTDYIQQVPFLSLTAWCSDAVKALEFLHSKTIDVIFLDLHLPGIKGFDFLRTLTHRPQVIITTAYQEHALEGYEWQVVDYLVKPVEWSRFLTAVNKLKGAAAENAKEKISTPESIKSYLFFQVEKLQVKVLLDEILFAESQKDYLKIYTAKKVIVTRQTMHELEFLLPGEYFIRVHRSYLVALSAIEAFDNNHVKVSGRNIPIGKNYRDKVIGRLKVPK